MTIHHIIIECNHMKCIPKSEKKMQRKNVVSCYFYNILCVKANGKEWIYIEREAFCNKHHAVQAIFV